MRHIVFGDHATDTSTLYPDIYNEALLRGACPSDVIKPDKIRVKIAFILQQIRVLSISKSTAIK